MHMEVIKIWKFLIFILYSLNSSTVYGFILKNFFIMKNLKHLQE